MLLTICRPFFVDLLVLKYRLSAWLKTLHPRHTYMYSVFACVGSFWWVNVGIHTIPVCEHHLRQPPTGARDMPMRHADDIAPALASVHAGHLGDVTR